MSHVVTYTSADGLTSYDLSGAGGSDGILGWNSGIGGWELDADSSTGEVTAGEAEFDCRVAVPRASLNAFQELLYRDALAGGGTLTAGGWGRGAVARAGNYERCPDGTALVDLTLYSHDPLWRRTTAWRLAASTASASATTDGLEYPADHPFDYVGWRVSESLANTYVETDFCVRLTFDGPCSSPYAYVSSTNASGTTTSNRYGVTAAAESGQRVVIDPLGVRTVGGSVYRVDAYGAKTNLFAYRARGTEGSGSYVFQRLPAGWISVSWPQDVSLTLEVIEERGSLPWT